MENKDNSCKECKEGKIIGIFYKTCTNPECSKYDEFANKKCGICGTKRYNCTC